MKEEIVKRTSEESIIVKCAHCGGRGDTDKECCQNRVGIEHSGVVNRSVVCCVCRGAGVVRI
jgi:hypothetical protein